MSGLYPVVEVAVVAASLAVLLFALAGLAPRRGLWPSMAWTAVGLGWFLVLWELARAGAFDGTRGSGRAAGIMACLGTLAVAWALLSAARRPGAPLGGGGPRGVPLRRAVRLGPIRRLLLQPLPPGAVSHLPGAMRAGAARPDAEGAQAAFTSWINFLSESLASPKSMDVLA